MKAKNIFITISLCVLFCIISNTIQAENNAAVSIEWMASDADLIITGNVQVVNENSNDPLKLITIEMDVDSCLKGMCAKKISFTIARNESAFDASFYYDKHVMVFLKNSPTSSKTFNLLKTPLSYKYSILDLYSKLTTVYEGNGKAVSGEKEIVKEVKQAVTNSNGAKANLGCIEAPGGSEASKKLFMGSSVILYVPDNLFPNAKKCQ